METNNQQQLYTLREASRLLSVSIWTLIDWRRQGRLRVVRLGRLVRVPASEIERITQGGLE